MAKISSHGSIERTHHVDFDVTGESNGEALELAAELAVGLLVTWQLVLPINNDSDLTQSDEVGLIRFFGPRDSLNHLLARVNAAVPERTW